MKISAIAVSAIAALSSVNADMYMMCTPNRKPTTDPAICKEHTPAVMEIIDICTGGKSASAKVDFGLNGGNNGATRNLRGDDDQNGRRLVDDACLNLDPGTTPTGLLAACCLIENYPYCNGLPSGNRRDLAADVSAKEASEALTASLPAVNDACTAAYKALAAQTKDHDCFGTAETAQCMGFYIAA